MVSERKLAANRRNAQRSTGPKTPAGKAAVRYNALQHGLLAQEVVITAGDGREDPAELQRLLSALVEDLQPVGALEDLLLQKIAICYWRLRRAVRVESAEIRRSYGVPPVEGAGSADSWGTQVAALLTSSAASRDLPGGVSPNLEASCAGLDRLLKIVTDACLTIQFTGQLTESCRDRLLNAYGKEEGSVGYTCFVHNYWITDRDKIAEEDPEKEAQGPSAEDCARIILFTLTAEERRLRSLRRKVVKREALERERKVLLDELDRACLGLPPEEATDRLLRYETAIERQPYRALAELEHLQRRRGGEAVPPPINVEVSNN